MEISTDGLAEAGEGLLLFDRALLRYWVHSGKHSVAHANAKKF